MKGPGSQSVTEADIPGRNSRWAYLLLHPDIQNKYISEYIYIYIIICNTIHIYNLYIHQHSMHCVMHRIGICSCVK